MHTSIKTRIPMRLKDGDVEITRTLEEAEQLAIEGLTGHIFELQRENPEKVFTSRWLDPIYNPSRDCVEQTVELEW